MRIIEPDLHKLNGYVRNVQTTVSAGSLVPARISDVSLVKSFVVLP